MKGIQVLSVAVLSFLLAAGGEISERVLYRRTLFSQPSDAEIAEANGGTTDQNTAPVPVAAAAVSSNPSPAPDTTASGTGTIVTTNTQSSTVQAPASEPPVSNTPGSNTPGTEVPASDLGAGMVQLPPELPEGAAAAGPPEVTGAATAGAPAEEKGPPAGESRPPTGAATAGTPTEEKGPPAGEKGPAADAKARPADAKAPPGMPPGLSPAEQSNGNVSSYLNYFFFGSVFLMLVYRLVRQGIRYTRTLATLDETKQGFFIEPEEGFAKIKKNIIHAPLFKHQRAQELRPFPSIHAGVLPTRFQTMYLVLFLGVNVVLTLMEIQWDAPYPAPVKQVRNRLGVLALGNLAPVIFVAGRHNPFCNLLHLPYDTFNMLHRWFARLLALQLTAHLVLFCVPIYPNGGLPAIRSAIENARDKFGMQYLLLGDGAWVALIVILFQASSPVRHAAYETFKMLHKLLVAAFLLGTYFHLRKNPIAASGVKSSIAVWAIDRIVRIITLVKHNAGKKTTRATVEYLPGDAAKVTVEIARPWKFVPGQHLYLYIPSVGFTQSHPFSIAWATTQTEDVYPLEKLPSNASIDSIKTVSKTTFQLIIRKRGGFTKKLVNKAQNAPGGRFTAFAMAEGPFGGHDQLTSYGSVMLFAGGVGITHMVPYIQQLVTCHSKGAASTRRIVLIWIIPRPDALNWIAHWMQEILAISGRRECLRLIIYITRLGPNENIESPSATIQIVAGRPNIGQLMDWETAPENQVGALGVSVCGGGALADDVRAAVRERQEISNIDFVEESFTW